MSQPAEERRTPAIGPIGTTTRLVVGLLLVAIAIAGEGLAGWDLAAAAIAFPAITWGLARLSSAAAGRSLNVSRLDRDARTWFTNVTVLVLFLPIATALTYVTPIDAGGIWLFFGISMIVGALRGDAGCEVLAIVNAGRGHRDESGCMVFAPLDSLDASRWAASNR